MQNEIYATYLIPGSRVEGLEKTIGKLARRIEKGKTHADIIPTVEDKREQLMVVGRHGGLIGWYVPGKDYGSKAMVTPYYWVTIRYQRPILNGWQLIAVYDWEVTPDGKRTCYVSPVPGHMVLPEHREVEDGQCDHCKTNRRRNKSMLVTQDFREFKVVGSTCIKDFLGHISPNSLIDVFSFEREIEEATDDHSGAGGAVIAMDQVSEILAVAAMVIRKYGFTPSNNWDGNVPTKLIVEDYMHPHKTIDYQFIAANPVEDIDRAKAETVLKWVEEKDDISDYFDTLKKAVAAGYVGSKRYGVVVSAVYSYDRENERKRAEKVTYVAEYLGNVGDRLRDITATVQNAKCIEGYYGTTTVITLRSFQGHCLTWFATGYHDAQPGDAWKLDGTVKKHNEYNGTSQTVLNRVKYKSLAAD